MAKPLAFYAKNTIEGVSATRWLSPFLGKNELAALSNIKRFLHHNTRDVFYVRREVDLMKTAKVNAYIMHIFGKIELLSIHAT